MSPDVPDSEIRLRLQNLQAQQLELEQQIKALREAWGYVNDQLTRYTNLYDSAPLGYFTIQPAGFILQVNLAGATLLGLDRTQLPGQCFHDFVTNDDWLRFNIFCDQVMGHPGLQCCHVRLEVAGSSPRPVRVQAFYDRGRSECQLIVSDLTQHQSAEKALVAAQAFSRAALDAMSAHICVLDPTGTIVAVNQAWRNLGPTPNPTAQALRGGVGVNYLDVCDAATGDVAEQAGQMAQGIRRVFSGDMQSFYLEFICPDDQGQRWLAARVTQFPDDSKRLLIAIEEITPRKQLELKLQNLNDDLTSTLNAIPDLLYELGLDGRYYSYSSARSELLAAAPQACIGRQVSQTMPRAAATTVLEALQQANQHGYSYGREIELPVGQDHRSFELSIARKNGKQGETARFVVLLRDITHKKLLERIHEKRRTDEAVQREVLVREVHHRIKNNLQGIVGILREFGRTHPETREPIAKAVSQVQSIAVIHGLQGKSSTDQVHLCELTQTIAEGIGSLWKRPIQVDIPAEWSPCRVAKNDAVPVALILNELILNAVKHSADEAAQVRVSLRKNGGPDNILISITNPGSWQARAGGNHVGLQLVNALMPRRGAKLSRHQSGEQFTTAWELEPPVIFIVDPEAQ